MAEETPNVDNTGARTEAANQNPAETESEARNAAAGEAPNAAGRSAPSTVEEAVPSTSDPEATDLPTQDNSDPKTANPAINPNATTATSKPAKSEATAAADSKPAQNQAETAEPQPESDTKVKTAAKARKPESDQESDPAEPKPAAKKQAPAGKPATKADEKKAKKEKKPAVEDKPFPEFIQQDYLPALEKALAKQNVKDLKLTFEQNEVTGRWNDGQRQFTVYFPKENINGTRGFSCASGGFKPSAIEPFLIDERKIDLELLTFGVVQRLNAQKWFGNN